MIKGGGKPGRVAKGLAVALAAAAGLGAGVAAAGLGDSTELGQTTTAPVYGAYRAVVQFANETGTKPYTTPKGVLTSWRYHSSGDSPAGTVQLQLFKRGTGAGVYSVVAESETKALEPDTPYEFTERIPVDEGWVLGLDPDLDAEVGITVPLSPGDQIYQFGGEIQLGQTSTATGPFPTYRVNVSATVERDADEDGFGDDTQDACPTDAAKQSECVAPETTITKRPANKLARKRAKYEFQSNEIGSTFECRLDRKPFKPCTSPRRLKARPGKHRFKVRATDVAGNVDPTPATDKFKRIDRGRPRS
jgi:hypothetical protein